MRWCENEIERLYKIERRSYGVATGVPEGVGMVNDPPYHMKNNRRWWKRNERKGLYYVTFSVESKVEFINSVSVNKYRGAIVAGTSVVQLTISMQ